LAPRGGRQGRRRRRKGAAVQGTLPPRCETGHARDAVPNWLVFPLARPGERVTSRSAVPPRREILRDEVTQGDKGERERETEIERQGVREQMRGPHRGREERKGREGKADGLGCKGRGGKRSKQE